MKKLIIAVALTTIMIGSAAAQTVKVDAGAIRKKIERSDADLENPKRNTKPAYWIERGKAFAEAGTAASTGLYAGMDILTFRTMFGNPQKDEVQAIDGFEYMKLTYPNFTAYLNGAELVFWEPTLVIVDGALDKSYEAYDQAYNIDNKVASRIKSGLEEVANEYKKNVEGLHKLARYEEVAESFAKAYDVQKHPALKIVDTMSLYNAGKFYAATGNYEQSNKYLYQAAEYGYDNDGEIYYLIFHNYYGMKDNDKAREVILEGVRKYPGNNDVVESLIAFYTSTDGDPKEIIPIVEESIAKDPENPALWNGLGGIYYKLADYDKSFEAFDKALQLNPNDPFNYLRVGSLTIDLGNEMIKEVNETNYSSYSESQKALERANDQFMKAIEPLEKGHQLAPENRDFVELLKNLTFRLRDRDGMMEKYEKYNEMLNSMPE